MSADHSVLRLDPATGHGIASIDGEAVAIPFSAPGDTVTAGAPPRIEPTSPLRKPPPCPHFGTCGGCRLQHMTDDAVADWKRGIVADALARHGIDAPVEATRTLPAPTRRRARFTLQRTKKTALFGFRAQGEHRVIDIGTCAILTPALLKALPDLRAIALAGAPRKRPVTIAATVTDTGLDVEVADAKELDMPLRETLSALAESIRLARLVWNGETVLMRHPPALDFGTATVKPPVGAFLQAAREAETVLLSIVREGIGEARRVADLFCGCGTFALPLAAERPVVAFDSDAPMIAALDAAARAAPLPVKATARDLFRRPLLPDELAAFDAVVIDPARAGAQAQMERLAASAVPVIASVSCNPVTFARDARILVDGGYAPERIVPVDQFRWSPHTEVVGIFRRAP